MSELAPNGLRSFSIKHPKLPDAKQCTLGVQLGGNQAQFLLISATPPPDYPYDTPMQSRLSSIVESHPVKNPGASGVYTFYMKTYSENEGTLEQMMAQGILEKVPGAPEVKQGFVSFPLVRVKIPLKEMSKQCVYCEKWEFCDDEQRLKGCSRCKDDSKVWYCNEDHQRQDWKEGHKGICGK